jgi:exosortase
MAKSRKGKPQLLIGDNPLGVKKSGRDEGNGTASPPAAVSLKDSISVEEMAWGAAFAALFLWSYWSTFTYLVERWLNVADYSHGFLVIPLALGFLWLRRDERPQPLVGARALGLVLIVAATGFRYFGARMFLPAFDGWSIPLWLAGICAWYGGLPLLRWMAPSLVFLLFMVPMPYRVEGALSMPLRTVATKASCWTLQCLGQPAVEDGATILMNSQEFDVADECSGLRMLVGIVALTFAYLMFSRRPWWQKGLLCLAAIPVAVFANVARITATALMYEHVSSEAGKAFSHDAAGWVTNGAAALLFACVLWLFSRMFIEYEVADRSAVIGLQK